MGLAAVLSGCDLNQRARFDLINEQAAIAEARADRTLATDEQGCRGDPDCLAGAMAEYAEAMRQIQAIRDARFDAELKRARSGDG